VRVRSLGRRSPRRSMRRPLRRAGQTAGRTAGVVGTVGLVGLPVVLLGGCSFFDRGDDTTGVSVFDVQVGECFQPPDVISVELTQIDRVPCDQPHAQEVYALVPYVDPSGTTSASSFPGQEPLTAFAQGACAQEFQDYVGVDYRDSRLWFTYLLPSARGWEQDADRTTVCVVTTTGEQLTRSVKGTGW